jgi:predicted TPR repeat methyltransferase
VQKERSAHFDEIYTKDPDPWGYLTSIYERGKYDATLAAFPLAGYRSGLEIGCSIGVLSRRLAVRCEQMLAVDISAVAIERACSLGDQPANLTFKRCDVPREWPDGRYDLIVLSEVLYYLNEDELVLLAERLTGSLENNGHCMLVNWLGDTGTCFTGRQAAARFKDALSVHCGFATLTTAKMEHYALELFKIG